MDAFLDFGAPSQLRLGTIVVRLALAVLFGAVIGIEREWRNHAAGLRTHMLTALAAAVFTVLTGEILFSEVARSEVAGD